MTTCSAPDGKKPHEAERCQYAQYQIHRTTVIHANKLAFCLVGNFGNGTVSKDKTATTDIDDTEIPLVRDEVGAATVEVTMSKVLVKFAHSHSMFGIAEAILIVEGEFDVTGPNTVTKGNYLGNL